MRMKYEVTHVQAVQAVQQCCMLLQRLEALVTEWLLETCRGVRDALGVHGSTPQQ